MRYKRGDPHPTKDGIVFGTYTKRKNKNGDYEYLYWITKEQYEKSKIYQKEIYRKESSVEKRKIYYSSEKFKKHKAEYDKNYKKTDSYKKYAKSEKARQSSNCATKKLTYGISKENYLKRLEDRKYLCDICKNPETKINPKSNKIQPLSIDHDHSLEHMDHFGVRGMLCDACNKRVADIERGRNIKYYISETNTYIKSWKDFYSKN